MRVLGEALTHVRCVLGNFGAAQPTCGVADIPKVA
jgi:hypothetical protein